MHMRVKMLEKLFGSCITLEYVSLDSLSFNKLQFKSRGKYPGPPQV